MSGSLLGSHHLSTRAMAPTSQDGGRGLGRRRTSHYAQSCVRRHIGRLRVSPSPPRQALHPAWRLAGRTGKPHHRRPLPGLDRAAPGSAILTGAELVLRHKQVAGRCGASQGEGVRACHVRERAAWAGAGAASFRSDGGRQRSRRCRAESPRSPAHRHPGGHRRSRFHGVPESWWTPFGSSLSGGGTTSS